jgi:hypothetical protein
VASGAQRTGLFWRSADEIAFPDKFQQADPPGQAAGPSRPADEELISADAPALNVAATGESSAAHLAIHKASEVGLNNPDILQCLSAEGYLMLERINIRYINRQGLNLPVGCPQTE